MNITGERTLVLNNDQLPPDLIVVVEWHNFDLPESGKNFAALSINGPEGCDVRLLEPNQDWKFVEGGDGELVPAEYDVNAGGPLRLRYHVNPDEAGYFNCFTDQEFGVMDHCEVMLRAAGVSWFEATIIPPLVYNPMNAMAMVKLLAAQLIVAQQERDEAQKLAEEYHNQMLESAAWSDSLLLRDVDTNPLRALVTSKTPEVAVLAKQVAGHVEAAFDALGIEIRGELGDRIGIVSPLLTCQAMFAYRPDLAPPKSA